MSSAPDPGRREHVVRSSVRALGAAQDLGFLRPGRPIPAVPCAGARVRAPQRPGASPLPFRTALLAP